MAQDPAFWQLVLGMALLCVLSGIVGLAWPDREPLLMDWALVLGGLGVAVLAAVHLMALHGAAALVARSAAALLELLSLLCLLRSRFWVQRRG